MILRYENAVFPIVLTEGSFGFAAKAVSQVESKIYQTAPEKCSQIPSDEEEEHRQ